MDEVKVIMKKEEISDLLAEVYLPEFRFFDRESNEMLDEKIEVLKALKAGKPIGEIPDFYKILELMPKDEMWD